MTDQEQKGSVSPILSTKHQETSGLSFSMALSHIKEGSCMARSGWNGKGMYIYHVPPRQFDSPNGIVQMQDYIVMKTAQGDYVPWVASQTDILANDWEVIDPA